jgi:hypothetical protein
MKRNMKYHTISRCAFACLVAIAQGATAAIVTFEDLTLSPNSFFNGGPVTNSNGWSSGGATFGNSYNSSFGGFWNGFSYSNVNDTTTPGFGNQYAAYSGTGFGGSGNYAVAYSGSQAFVNLPTGTVAQSVYLTNTTYAALSMLNGDMFAKKFGGLTGNDPDFFDITITGYGGLGATGLVTGSTTFRLADYTFSDNSLDYIRDTWELVDLTPVGSALSLGFSWASSDTSGAFINTPTYFAMDHLTVIPEPSAVLSSLLGLGILLRRKR